MSAICGFHLREERAADGLAAMLAALSDYGKTGAQWREGAVGLGCRYPTAANGDGAGRAPCLDRDAAPRLQYALQREGALALQGGIAVAADARLDDRDTLCGALGVPRAERRALTDGGLVLRAWQRWGRDCPNHLLGDYAFAVWDANERTLFCARDHAGVRPLYYCLAPEGFVFASAVEAVLAMPGVSGALDEATVAAYLTGTGWNSATRTFFREVRKLPPGHTLTVEGDRHSQAALPRAPFPGPRVRIERWWRPERTPAARPASDDEYAEELLALYTRAVQDRLCGGPVGVHLSGGLDSSSVAVLAARALRRQGRPAPPAFSWLPALGEAPPAAGHAAEYGLIDAVCRQEDLRVFHRTLSVGDMLAILRRDGAFPGVHVQMNEEAVQRCAAESGVRVLLSGWGGDEGVSFNGRGFHQHLLLGGRWLRLAAECRATSRPFRTLADAALSIAHPGLRVRMGRRWRGEEPHRRRWLIDPAFARRAKPLPVESFRPIGVRRTQARLLRSGHLCQRIEGWAASGARHGIEYRYPLLDRRLLEFALGLPPEQFRRGRWSRWLMRHALGTVLPPEVRWNPGKADPARLEPLLDTFAEARPALGRILAARADPPSRACYVDMPRLLERLDAGRSSEFLSTWKPLQLLDF